MELQNINGQYDCPKCLEPLEIGKKDCIQTDCSHIFHKYCFNLSEYSNCLICKNSIKQLHDLQLPNPTEIFEQQEVGNNTVVQQQVQFATINHVVQAMPAFQGENPYLPLINQFKEQRELLGNLSNTLPQDIDQYMENLSERWSNCKTQWSELTLYADCDRETGKLVDDSRMAHAVIDNMIQEMTEVLAKRRSILLQLNTLKEMMLSFRGGNYLELINQFKELKRLLGNLPVTLFQNIDQSIEELSKIWSSCKENRCTQIEFFDVENEEIISDLHVSQGRIGEIIQSMMKVLAKRRIMLLQRQSSLEALLNLKYLAFPEQSRLRCHEYQGSANVNQHLKDLIQKGIEVQDSEVFFWTSSRNPGTILFVSGRDIKESISNGKRASEKGRPIDKESFLLMLDIQYCSKSQQLQIQRILKDILERFSEGDLKDRMHHIELCSLLREIQVQKKNLPSWLKDYIYSEVEEWKYTYKVDDSCSSEIKDYVDAM